VSIDAFLKIKDVKGESVVMGHEDEIQIHSWSWGASQNGTLHRGKGGGAGKADISDMSIQKNVDSASPALFLACCNGKHYDQAVLTVRKAGETPLDYMTITLSEVLVTSVSSGGSSGGDSVSESITLNFAKVKVSYQPQNSKGGKEGGAIDAEYDIAKNA
jgi:type VI secretion system secreted protein Hcp